MLFVRRMMIVAKNEFVDMFVKAIGEVTNGLGIKARELAEKLGISINCTPCQGHFELV